MWKLSINSVPDDIYNFETYIYDDKKLLILLTNVKNQNIKYLSEYNYDEISKAFQVLPKSNKDELTTLISYQVFISGLVNNNKIELFFAKNNRIKLELKDIAKAPKGAMYNVTLFLSKIEK